MALYMDESQIDAYCRRHGFKNPLEAPRKTKPPATSKKASAGSKYKNIKTKVDGYTFDSRREAARYQDLKLMAAAREIVRFDMQVPFDLPGGIRYIADFVILHRDGTWTVEDAKGMRTDVYIMKKKLMREHWGIEIVEV